MGNNKKIFIDGLDGTTGLKIKEKLSQRREISLLEIDPILRKNLEEKKKLMALADVVVLCLPDAIAKESFEIAKSLPTKILDASTAHRTNSNWIYGFPELKGYREKIMQAKYVVNPGCYATAAIALLEPLIRKNLFTGDEALTIHAVSGYSGGGKKLIQKYENNKIIDYSPYALNLKHKHLPEIVKVSGLKTSPLFSPAVVPYYQGLLLQIPLHKNLFKYSSQQIIECYQDYYTEEKISQSLSQH